MRINGNILTLELEGIHGPIDCYIEEDKVEIEIGEFNLNSPSFEEWEDSAKLGAAVEQAWGNRAEAIVKHSVLYMAVPFSLVLDIEEHQWEALEELVDTQIAPLEIWVSILKGEVDVSKQSPISLIAIRDKFINTILRLEDSHGININSERSLHLGNLDITLLWVIYYGFWNLSS